MVPIPYPRIYTHWSTPEFSFASKRGGCYREDGSQEVWDTFLEQTRGRFSGDELCRLQDTAQKLSESDPLVQDYVGLLSGTLSGYCLPPSKLDAFEAAMQEYVGTHNFHNFTTGKLWGILVLSAISKGCSVAGLTGMDMCADPRAVVYVASDSTNGSACRTCSPLPIAA